MISALTCMAVAIYFEARGEDIDGQIMVAEVIMNRINDTRWPDNACDVVAQPHQFSFYDDGRSNIPRDMEAYTTAVLIAQEASMGEHLGTGALYYHHITAQPAWRHRLQFVGIVGSHIFYADRLLAPTESPRPIMRGETND